MAADGETCLVLWDIDNTLIESRGVGRLVYQRVFPEVTGKPLRSFARFAGRTELDIMRETLRLHDVEPTERIVQALTAALAQGFRAAVGELTARGRVLPGVWQVLRALQREPCLHQSLLTGNTTEVARIKVAAFGLDRYFDLDIGAYGDDSRDRAELVSLARDRAAARRGVVLPARQVVLIGDTPNDVAAALAAGAHIIGVATGDYSAGELHNAGAETTFETLADLPRLQRVLTGLMASALHSNTAGE
ncbi:MAG: HAD family hydrolase [Sciscionella sp.]